MKNIKINYTIGIYLLWCCFVYFPLHGFGQSGAPDLTFRVGSGTGGSFTYAIVIQPDGKIVIGGAFTSYQGIVAKYITRLQSDGSADTSFHTFSGANSQIMALALQSDGKIIAGGQFTNYGGLNYNRLVRINADGSADTTFHIGSGLNGSVYAIAIQDDGKIIVGGLFSDYNGISQNNITRLNADGSYDSTFNTGTGANAAVQAIALQSDGQIVAGGDFMFYNGSLAVRVVRITTDGSIDPGFNSAIGTDKVVYSIAIQSNGEIIIGGAFTSYQLQPRNNIARLDPNGNLDAIFNPVSGTNTGSQIDEVLILGDNKILVVGKFLSFNGDTLHDIAILTDTAKVDVSFNPKSGANADILCASQQTDGKIIIGGMFVTYYGLTLPGIARLYNCTLPQPGPITGDSTTLCGGTGVYSISPVAGADNYSWTLPSGWTGSSDSASIIATSNGSGGVISVTANSSLCGASAAQTDSITRIQPPGVPICLATVDTQSTHNIIYWDKPVSTLIDSFFIYREITTNNYSKIGAVPYDSLSEYNDYAANPNTTSFTYKLSTLDNCGAESDLSLYHSTINLQNLGSGNFQWTFYEIENSPNPVLSFNVYRDDLGNGNFSQIGLVPGTNATFTDVTYNAFPNAVYVVDVQWSISCHPTRAISTTRSNIRNGAKSLGISESAATGDFEIYPNPAAKELNLLLPSTSAISSIKICNALGQLVWAENQPAQVVNGLKQINIENLAAGLYTLTIETGEGTMNRKLIIR